jgi:uncharacterized protein DUF3592
MPTTLLAIFSIIAFAVMALAARNAWKSVRAKSWPIVPGTLTEVKYVEASGDNDTHKVEAKYTYSVAGKVYESSQIAFGYGGSSVAGRNRKLYKRLKLKEGELIEIRHDPSNPAQAVLEPGLNASNVRLLVWAAIFMLFPGLGIYQYIERELRLRPDPVPPQSVVSGMPTVWKSTVTTNTFLLSVDQDVVRARYLNGREQKVAGVETREARLTKDGDNYLGVFTVSLRCTLPTSDPESVQSKMCVVSYPLATSEFSPNRIAFQSPRPAGRFNCVECKFEKMEPAKVVYVPVE